MCILAIPSRKPPLFGADFNCSTSSERVEAVSVFILVFLFLFRLIFFFFGFYLLVVVMLIFNTDVTSRSCDFSDFR